MRLIKREEKLEDNSTDSAPYVTVEGEDEDDDEVEGSKSEKSGGGEEKDGA